MSTSNVRKKLFSKNTQNQVNKKVATGEAGEQKKEEKVSSEIISNDFTLTTKPLTIGIKEKEKENTEEEKDKDKKVKELQEKTIELEDQLKTLKEEYKSKQTENIETIKNTNNDLDRKREDANKSSKKNHQLIIKLKNIEKELKEKYIKVTNFKSLKKLKINIAKTNQKELAFKVKVKEKQIENIKKVADKEKAQQIKYENLLKDDKLIQKQPNLQKEFNAINDKIKNIKKELEELYALKSKHLACTRQIESLRITFNIMNNEIEYESKKNRLITSTIENKRSNKGLIEGFPSTSNLQSLPNIKLDYSKKLRDSLFKQKRPPEPKKVAKSAFKYIKTEFDLIEGIKKNPLKKSSRNIFNKPQSLIDNVYVSEPNLFTEREAKILKTVLPESYMAKYMEKYDEKKVEKEEIENKFGEFEEKKK